MLESKFTVELAQTANISITAQQNKTVSNRRSFWARDNLPPTKETNVAHAHNSIWNGLNFIRNAGKEETAAVVLTALISLNVYPVFRGKGRRKNV